MAALLYGRASTSRLRIFSSNHIGQFMFLMYPLCKSLFIGGVTKRFPCLPFAFLECGSA